MCFGVSPSGTAQDFDSCIRWFESNYPSYVYSWKLYIELLAECCLDKEMSSFKECVAMLWRYAHTARKESVIIYIISTNSNSSCMILKFDFHSNYKCIVLSYISLAQWNRAQCYGHWCREFESLTRCLKIKYH